MDVNKIFEYALAREREGYEFFSSHAEKAQHAAVIGVFQRLAAEEKAHIRYIERLMADLAGEKLPEDDRTLVDHDKSFFSERAASEMIDQTTIEAMVPDLPVLRMAFLIERDLAEFYSNLAPKAEGEARKALEKLAAWEREHERLFKSLHDKIFAEYSGMPWGG
ncbi:MAG: ferritin family protein [Pirellulales bacterium]|nr:ferritin family protein [Pirellulales bacterium]